MSTSGRIHGEFLRLLHILSHRQTVKFFDTFGEKPPDKAFTFRRAAYFFHSRATLGLARAQAIAIRTHVPPHIVQRPLCATPRECVSTPSFFYPLLLEPPRPLLFPLPFPLPLVGLQVCRSLS